MTEFTREPPAMVQFVEELDETAVVVAVGVVVVGVFSDSMLVRFLCVWVL